MMRQVTRMRAHSTPARAAGFTLIELMIAVGIATLLLTIAIPSYRSQIQKSRRTDAKTALLDLASREQRYFSVNNAFTASGQNLGYVVAGATFNVGSGYYSVTVTAPAGANPPTFSITATPIAGTTQAGDADCTSFTVDNTGNQTATGANPTTCWQ